MSEQPAHHQRFIFIVSDATGRTGRMLIETALAQFRHTQVHIKVFGAIGFSDIYRLDGIVENAAFLNALIAFTFVVPEMQERLRTLCEQHGVSCIDLIGPSLLHLSNWLEREPSHSPDASIDRDDYFQRVMALDFALRHDDGRHADGLRRAEIVLVGPSRCSKTPLSVYLAYRGWLVGNIPLAPSMEPPAVLFELPPGRIVGLTVRPDRLARLREQRQAQLGYTGDYADVRAVRDESQQALALYASQGWPVVDMTYKSIEEAGQEVLGHLQGADFAGKLRGL